MGHFSTEIDAPSGSALSENQQGDGPELSGTGFRTGGNCIPAGERVLILQIAQEYQPFSILRHM
jgi:hypothetical protein